MAGVTGARQEVCRIRLRVLGGFATEAPSGERLAIKNRKARALLAYLALSQNGSESRERLAGLLWSDSSEEQARASLRQCIKQLRDLFAASGVAAFGASRQDIDLIQGNFVIDLIEVQDQLRSGRVDATLLDGHLLPDRILYGYEDLDQAFTAWLHVVRQTCRSNIVDELQRLLRSKARDVDGRRHAAEALLAIDGTHEEASRFLIGHYASSGNTAEALRQYNRLWDLLDREYDTEPAAETQALIVKVKSGEHIGSAGNLAPGTTPPAMARLPVLAVSPFDSRGLSDPGSYIVGGFHRDLIACLIRFREWVIIETTRAEAPAPADRPGARVERIDYLLEGAFFQDGVQVHVVMTLKETHTARYIWSERFALGVQNWFAAQQHFVRRMSAGLNIYMSAERVAKQVLTASLPLETYDLWLRANDLFWSWKADARARAERHFREVIERTPTFAPAYSGIASILNTRHAVSPGVFPNLSLAEEATHYAQQAVALDPLDARGQIALAWSCAMSGRFDQAEVHFSLCYDLNPNNPTTLVSCANGMALCGQHDLARQLADQAVHINPMMTPFHWSYLVGTRFLCFDYAGAVDAAGLAQDAIPIVPGWRAAALGLIGKRPEAQQAAQRFLEFVRSQWIGERPCTDEEIVRWFLRNFPIRDAAARDRLQEGLRVAGLPVGS